MLKGQTITLRRSAGGALVLAVLAGALLLRHTETGIVLRTVPVPGGPSAVAVDAQTGRAVVLSTGYSPAGYRGYVTVLDTATGALLHTEPVGRIPTDILLDQQTSRVFITDNATGTVSVLDAASGRLLQTTAVGVLDLPGGSAASLEPLGLRRIALDARSNRVFVSAIASFRNQLPFGGAVRVFDARTGVLLRTVRAGGGTLAGDDRTGRVFVASIDGDSVTMLDAHSGAVLRTIPRIGIGLLAVDARAGHVFVPGERGLSMLDARTGRLLRTAALTTATGAVVLTVDEADGRLFVGDDVRFPPFHGVLQVFDTRTGALMRTVAIVRPSSSGIVVVDGRDGRAFLINRPAGTVSVLDARRGIVVRTAAAGVLPDALAVDERRERVVVLSLGTVSAGAATGPGRVSMLDARSGAILSSSAAGWGPIAVAVDERTGHAFVANAGGAMRLPDFWGWVPSWIRGWLPFLPHPSFRTRPVPASVSVIDTTR